MCIVDTAIYSNLDLLKNWDQSLKHRSNPNTTSQFFAESRYQKKKILCQKEDKRASKVENGKKIYKFAVNASYKSSQFD